MSMVTWLLQLVCRMVLLLCDFRQYMNEEQVWAGLVVQLIQTIEAVMPQSQRWLLAWRYSLCTKGAEVFTHLLMPVFLTSVITAGLVAFGVVQLQSCLRICPTPQCLTKYMAQNGSFTQGKPCNCTDGASAGTASSNSTANFPQPPCESPIVSALTVVLNAMCSQTVDCIHTALGVLRLCHVCIMVR